MIGVLVLPGKPAFAVNVTLDKLKSTLGWISFAYPYDDPVCLAHDDDGISNGRMPNRTINGTIMPGPFYVLGVTPDDGVTDLDDALVDKYIELFKTPEHFAPGHWNVTTKVSENEHAAVISLISEWMVDNSVDEQEDIV